MQIAQQVISIGESASRIYRFEEVYSFRAAQEQAEKEKLSAFGMLAKLNPLNRPKADTVLLARPDQRWEPFWFIQATRTIDYSCAIQYPIQVHNPHAHKVEVLGKEFDLNAAGSKARFDLPAIERCHRKLPYSTHIDGLQRDIKAQTLNNYCSKYKYQEVQEVSDPNVVVPLLPHQSVVQMATSALNKEAINAHEISQDTIHIESIHLYLRPVFAFEFIWSSADKVGVIEVDGLTGAVKTDGQWFAEKMEKILTRDMLVEAGAEIAGSLMPGGSFAVKMINQLATAPAQNKLPRS